VGRAPKAEFKVGGKSYKIDPEAKSTKQVRALPSEHFNPITRPQRVEQFYREALKDRYEESRRRPLNSGPFRHEFVRWTDRWPAALRARWAWHNRIYIEDALWTQWMADPAFAAEINVLQGQNTPAVIGYLPPEYAATSPVFVYNDEFLNAAYNPIPFLAVLTLKSLKPDDKTDWIGIATAESLVTRLGSTPGLFLAERQQVMEVVRDQKLREPDVAEAQPAAQVGKALDVERVVVGSYVVDGDDVLFNLRIVDVQTGVVETGISKTVPREHLLTAMPDLASSLADALGFQPQDESAADPISSVVTNSIGMKLVYIPAGKFLMGSPGSEAGEPQYAVKLTKPFRMQTTPVTQSQWKAVMGTDPSRFKGDDLPVEQVSWHDAVEFCHLLSQKEGRHYRLPTEAEWEYSCRAGTTTIYYTGNGEAALGEAGWYEGNSSGGAKKGHTQPVGRKKPNAWGLYDMHGNVWQWCNDWRGDYPAGEALDPTGPDSGPGRVLRGGAWTSGSQGCRAACRYESAPDRRRHDVGFRVCLDSEPGPLR